MYNIISSINLDKLLAFSQFFFFFKKFFTKLSEQTNRKKKFNIKWKLVEDWKMFCWSLLTSVFLSPKVGWLWGLWRFVTRTFVFRSTADPKLWREIYDVGTGEERGEEDRGGECLSGGKTRHTVTQKKGGKTKTHPLHPSHPKPCILSAFLLPLLHVGGSDLHWLDLVHLCPHHLDAVEDLLLMAC